MNTINSVNGVSRSFFAAAFILALVFFFLWSGCGADRPLCRHLEIERSKI